MKLKFALKESCWKTVTSYCDGNKEQSLINSYIITVTRSGHRISVVCHYHDFVLHVTKPSWSRLRDYIPLGQ